MKRFFQPVKKDESFKKPNLSENTSSTQIEQQRREEEGEDTENAEENNNNKEPTKFVTWNANSFLLRVKNNWPEFTKFVETHDPDVIAVQVIRISPPFICAGKGSSKNPGELKDDTNASREEKQIVMRALSSPPFRKYNVWWSLSESKYAGTALLVKKRCQPTKVSFSLDRIASKHEADGRVILAEFESFRLLNTYVPNNGWKEEENAFQRRRKWDKRILEFVMQSSDKPLIWCGDLNVSATRSLMKYGTGSGINVPVSIIFIFDFVDISHQEIDVSHPDFFSAAKLNGYVPPNKEDCGQPGFTLNERKRFSAILTEGKLIDAYRYLHKEKDMDRGFSWSGHPIGKYRGKKMRIDYFIVSEKLKDRIVACEMHGHGIELEGFYGSDHCPVSLELSTSSDSSQI
ncbi:hypothetical protein Syun_020342 [Stephania yunnanensis]|uniref:Endonuclease/exonuclease/phosphatase domain-containing protein n=1 Tax=Stephania yunnanensis TaxID=152371 RepID=A0AAP0NPX3_9MAGN